MPRNAYHSLKKPKIRQDWSKRNLYKLMQMRPTSQVGRTFFQQKWIAKSETRGYFSPQLRERAWERMFDRRLPGVVPMDYKYLARYDGSEQATGRGSGAEIEPGKEAEAPQNFRPLKTSYMHMAFFPLERRLDTAIWRALFASSAKQARQFVLAGKVTVNGKKMKYPGYLLNPGDMFAVDPDSVMFATGQPKLMSQGSKEKVKAKDETEGEGEEGAAEEAATEEEVAKETAVEEVKQATEDPTTSSTSSTKRPVLTAEQKTLHQALMEEVNLLRNRISAIVMRGPKAISEATLRDLDKIFRKERGKLRHHLNWYGVDPAGDRAAFERLKKRFEDVQSRMSPEELAILNEVPEEQLKDPKKFAALWRQLHAGTSNAERLPGLSHATVTGWRRDPKVWQPKPENTADESEVVDAARSAAIKSVASSQTAAGTNDGEAAEASEADSEPTVSEQEEARVLQALRENPVDSSKPYATPWKPRDYMSAFAFVPRYLEVNQNICAAVYLRHPVARPGLSEVPGPFSADTMALAFNWYLRRR